MYQIIGRGLLTLFLVAVRAEKLNQVSFAPPFATLQDHWFQTNKVAPKGDKIPLTEGGPGDTGAIWSKQPVNLMEFSAVLEVSVDGAGTNDPETSSTFGLFFAQNKDWIQGSGKLAGSSDLFTGFAIQIHLSAKHVFEESHKEVRVLINTGKKKYTEMLADEHNCKVGFALEKVKLKLMMIQDMLFVVTDEHGDGHWSDCASLPLGLGDMMKAAYIGVSSNTGPRSVKPAQIYSLSSLVVFNRWDEAEVGERVEHHDMVDPHQQLDSADKASIIYSYHEGHLDGQAEDLHVEVMTTEEAKTWCTNNIHCLSFCQQGDTASSTEPVTTYFKDTVTWAKNVGWHAYIKSTAPEPVQGISPEEAAKARAEAEAEAEAAGFNVEDTLQKMQLHEWASEQRLEILESKLRDKILEKITLVEEAIKLGMDTQLFDRLRAIEDRVAEQSGEKLQVRVDALEKRLKDFVEVKLMDKVKELEEKVKAHLDAKKSNTRATVNDALKARLDKLEQRVKDGMKQVVQDKISGRKEATKQWVDQLSTKLHQRQEQGLEQVKAHISGVAQKAAEGGSGYFIPFLVLAVVVAGVSVFFYIQYDKMRKTHLL